MRVPRSVVALAAGGVLLAGCQEKEKKPDVAALVAELQSPDQEKSGRANLALITIGEPAVPALVELLKSEDPRARTLAATTFWGMGTKARAAVPALSETLADKDPGLRVASAMALETMGPEARAAVLALVKCLGDREGRVRQAAVKALARIGPDAREAIPALRRSLKKGPWPEAEEAIRLIQGVSAAPPAETEREGEPSVR